MNDSNDACKDFIHVFNYSNDAFNYSNDACKDVAVQRLYFIHALKDVAHVYKDVAHIICFFFEKKPSKSLLFENFGLILYKDIHIIINH